MMAGAMMIAVEVSMDGWLDEDGLLRMDGFMDGAG